MPAPGGLQAGVAFTVGDVNADGWFDLVITNFQNQLNLLYHNNGDGTFSDATLQSGFAKNNAIYAGWAVFFFDYDNDGDLDLFVGNGHLQDRIEAAIPSESYFQPNQLYRNHGDGTFEDVGAQVGPGFQVRLSTRGGVFGDLDNDGDLDVVLSNSRREPTILLNHLSSTNHWINLQLQGVHSNRDGIGARVELTAGGVTQYNEVRAVLEIPSGGRCAIGDSEANYGRSCRTAWRALRARAGRSRRRACC